MDALFRIMARIQAVDQASGVVNRVAGAFQRLGHTIGLAAASVLAFGGAKGFYDWTLGAASNLQQMELGMAAIITANSQLQGSVHKAGSEAFQMTHFNIAAKEANQLMELLQQRSIAGIGTLENYVTTANTIMPALLAGMKDASPERIAEFVHLTQMSAATLLAGRGDGAGMFNLAAREMAHALQGSARSNMPYVRNLLSDIPHLKTFNDLSQEQRLKVLEEHLQRYRVLSQAISGSWANVASAAQEMVGYIGRNVGRPMLDFLQQAIASSRTLRLLLRNPNDQDLSGPGSKEDNHKRFIEESTAAWDRIRNRAIEIGQHILTPVIFLRNNWDAIAATMKSVGQTLLIAAAAWIAASLAMRVSGAVLATRALFMGQASRFNSPMMAMLARSHRTGGMMDRGGMFFARGLHGMQNRAHMGLMGAAFSAQNNGHGRLAGLLGRLGSVIASIGGPVLRVIGLFSFWGVIIAAVGGAVAVVAGNFMGARDILLKMLGTLWNSIQRLWATWSPILAQLGRILMVLAVILGVMVVAAVMLVISVFNFLVNVATAVGQGITRMVDVMRVQLREAGGFFINVANSIIDGINAIANFAARLGFGKGGTLGHIGQGAMGTDAAWGGIGADMALGKGQGWLAQMKAKWDAAAAESKKFGAEWKNPFQSAGNIGNLKMGGMGAHDEDGSGKGKKKAHPRNVQIFNKGAIQIEIKNMNNYPPDRVAYDMKKVLMDKLNQKTQGTSGGIGYGASFGGR